MSGSPPLTRAAVLGPQRAVAAVVSSLSLAALGSVCAFSLMSSTARANDTPPSVPPTHTVLPAWHHAPERIPITFTATSDAAFLQRDVDGRWVDVCRAPCTTYAEFSARYHVDGPGLSTSRELAFPARASLVHADTGSLPVRVGGIVTTSVGGMASLFGLTITYVSRSCETYHCDPEGQARNRNLGLATLGVGAVVMVAGFLMMASGATTVEVTRATRGEEVER